MEIFSSVSRANVGFPDPNINSFISPVFFYVQVQDKRKESGVNLNSAELLVLRNAAFHSACYF